MLWSYPLFHISHDLLFIEVLNAQLFQRDSFFEKILLTDNRPQLYQGLYDGDLYTKFFGQMVPHDRTHGYILGEIAMLDRIGADDGWKNLFS